MTHLTKDVPGTHIRESYDHLSTWRSDADGFRLELFDTYQVRRGKSVLAYQFFHNDVLVFEGDEYGCAPSHAVGGDLSIASLLFFLSLKPGDTDSEYFERHEYTREQLEWAKSHGEELGLLADELESGITTR